MNLFLVAFCVGLDLGQDDHMSKSVSVLSNNSARKGSVQEVPAVQHTIVSTRATQLGLEENEPLFPWAPGSSSRKKFEKSFHEWHATNCSQHENVPHAQKKLSVILDCHSQFLTNSTTKTSVEIDRFFGVFDSSSYHEALALEKLTAHWKPEPVNLSTNSEVRVPPGNSASNRWISMHAALSKQAFGQDLTAGAKAAIGDLLHWLTTLNYSKSSHPILA